MTDKELIALVESKLPQELSLAELELIQHRLRESPAVREALAGQLELNEYLATVISPVELSVDDVFKAGRSDRYRRRSVWTLLGWTVCLLMVAFVVSVLALSLLNGPRDRNGQLAQAGPGAKTNLPKSDSTDPSAAAALAGNASASRANRGANGQSGNPSGNESAKNPGNGSPLNANPAATGPGANSGNSIVGDRNSNRPKDPVDEPPQFPWQAKDQLAAPPRPWDQAALEMVGIGVANGANANVGFPGNGPGMADAMKWFKPVPGKGQIQLRDWQGHRIPAIDGMVRFRGPWAEDNVLRLSMSDCVPLTIHFWKGQTGLTVRMHNNRWALSAYGTHRDGDQAVPTQFVTLATDDLRNWNSCSGTYPMRMDLRFHGGEFTLSRGDLVLLRAPFDGLPTETYFDGRPIFAGLDMVRVTGDLPAETDPLPIAKELNRPADLTWHSPPEQNQPQNQPGKAGQKAKQAPAVEFNKLANGSVELKFAGSKTRYLQWFDLPQDGLYEVEMELDHVTPGSRVVFGSGTGEPLATVGFFRHGPTHGMTCRLDHLYDEQSNFDQQFNNEACSFAAPHEWIKLVGGCGITRLYGSADGIHWAWFGMGQKDFWSPPLVHLGLGCVPGDGARSIMLRRVVLREFGELKQLAPAELLAKAPTIGAENFQQWESEVAKHPAPAGASPGAWQRACALRSVLGYAPDSLGRQLIAGLFGYSLNQPMSVERRLRLLNEIATVSDVWSDGNAAANLVTRFELLGQKLIRQQYPTPWTAVDGAVLRAPIWSQGNFPTQMPSLARAELMQLVYSNQPEQVLRAIGRLRLANSNDPLILWADEWASAQSGSFSGDVIAAHVGRNPLIDDLNKDGFSTLSEFESAIDSQSFHDACQVITSPGTLEINGLMPDPRDPQLSVSLDTALGAALNRYAPLRDMMAQQFGPAGMLEVHRAIDQSDADAVMAAAMRYRGTQAAAEACLWLGDRAVGGGEFNRARVWYDRAKQGGGTAIAARIAPRERLAAAMVGEDAGSPPTSPVQFGEVTMSPSEFELLVADMRKVHSVGGRRVATAVAASTATISLAPAPSGFELQQLERFDGDGGDNPGDVNNATPARENSMPWLRPITAADVAGVVDSPIINTSLDWAARQLSVAGDGDRLYVSNRFQVSAYETKSGHRVWRTELGGEHGRTHDWTLTPMRPLPVGRQLFVRRLTRTHPELAALNAESGAVRWRSSPTTVVVSDPVWLGDEVAAICAMRGDDQTVFSLAVFDPADGSLRRSQAITAMHDSWWSERTCQITQSGDDLIAVLCGAVVCCDVSGKPRWIRRQEWISPMEDRSWGRQAQAPPFVADGKVLVTQPGVMAVECLDLQSGALLWRTAMPGIHRAIGVAGDRLLAETDYGIAGLSVKNGEMLWYHPAIDLLEAQLCGGPGQFVYTYRQAAPGNPNQSRPVMVWLDAATGAETARHALDSLRQDHPLLGPFAAAGDHLWVFAAGSDSDPTRSIYELRPKGPAIGMHPVPANPRIAGDPRRTAY